MLSRTLPVTFALITLLAGIPALAQEITLDLDPAHTTVEFTLGASLHTVHGSFKLKGGTIHFDHSTGKITGEAVVDATSGQSGNDGRDRRMHDSILESARYPDIVFVPDRVDGSVSPEGSSQVQVHGMFRIHGSEHEITLPVQIQMVNGRPVGKLHFTIPYVRWGLKNPSTLFLRVSDKVDIDITVYTR